MAFSSKYGVARHIYIPIPKAGSANHAVGADWTPATGDVKISKDGGAAANVTNLPTAIAMGNSAIWDFSLTATEMQAAQINVTVADSATKAVDDTGFIVETYGNASAQHAFDLGTASTAQTGDSYGIVNNGTYGNSALETLVDDLENKTVNLFDLIEYQRGSHTGRGNVYYWDPVNGNDSNSGLRSNLAKLTWAGVNALVTAYNHDIIIAMPGDSGAPTSIDATIELNKAFTFLRGPGRDFRFKPTGTTADTVVISAIGCELSGFIVETHTAGSRDAVKVTADFAKMNNVWVDYSRGHGIALENASNCVLRDIVVQDAALSGSGHGISVKSTSGTSTRNFMNNLKVLECSGDGIRFDGANTTYNVISSGENGCHISHNTAYGVNEVNGANHTHLLGPGLLIEGNTSGDINLTGADSNALNWDQLARATTLSSAMGATFDTATDSLEALRNRGDAAWITATGFSTHSAADVWAVATRTLTAGTNIALAKGVGVTGFNDVSTSDVTTSCTSALNTYDPPTNAELEARTPSAAELAYIVNHAKTAPSVTFTGGTTTTAILGNVDGSAASSINDFYNGRVLIFNAGTLDEQATDITDYDGSTKTATITAVTTAVTAAHTAIMV